MGERKRKHRLPAGALLPKLPSREDVGSSVRAKVPPGYSDDATANHRRARLLVESTEETGLTALAINRDPALLQPLTSLALDESRQVRRTATQLLHSYEGTPGYARATAQLRLVAAYPERSSEERRLAIAALSRLRDKASFAIFVELLAEPDRRIAAAARVGLRVLTAHDLGFAREPWERWAKREEHKDRVQWLIEGLGDSRAHLRALASRELAQLTSLQAALTERSPRSAFVRQQRAYERWWGDRSECDG